MKKTYEVQVTFHLKLHNTVSIDADSELEAYEKAKQLKPGDDVEFDEFEVTAEVTDVLAECSACNDTGYSDNPGIPCAAEGCTAVPDAEVV